MARLHGPAGTTILADTIGCHRGGKPEAGTRLLATFTYTSGTPLVEHSLRLKGEPAWMSSAIQRHAVKQLPITPARPPTGGHTDKQQKKKAPAR